MRTTALVTCLGACQSDSQPPDANGEGSANDPDDDTAVVAGLVAAHCLGCHDAEGPSGLVLTSMSALGANRAAIGAAVTEHRMPPFMPAPGCGAFAPDPRLADDEVAAFRDWAAGRAVVKPAVGPTETSKEEPVSTVLGPTEPFVPLPSDLNDRTVCHEFGPPFATMTRIRGVRIRPSDARITHHFVLGAAPPEALIADTEALGTVVCPYDRWQPLLGLIQTRDPNMLPDGMAFEVPAGWSLVVEVHYNVAALRADEPIPAESHELDLWLAPTDSAAAPARFDVVAADDLHIPAGNPDALVVGSRTFSDQIEILGIAPHMHIFGTGFRAELVRADGTTECLVDIPRWQFREQRTYFRPAESPIRVGPGDRIDVQCRYDNSASNQPVVRGSRAEPKDISFGWRGTDEMCELPFMTR